MAAEVTSDLVGKIICPGDKILDLPPTGVVRVGRGLEQDAETIIARRAGVLQQAANGRFWIHGRQKRYIPVVNDAVVGIITRWGSETYEVDINGPVPAALNSLAFEGVNRRNKPQLQEGDVVYARVETAAKDIQPTLVCMDAIGKASGFGVLKGGTILTCDTSLARQLTSQPPPEMLSALGAKFTFELAVGANGRIWVDGKESEDTIAVCLALEKIEGRSGQEQRAIVDALAKR